MRIRNSFGAGKLTIYFNKHDIPLALRSNRPSSMVIQDCWRLLQSVGALCETNVVWDQSASKHKVCYRTKLALSFLQNLIQTAVKCVEADPGWVKRIMETDLIKRWNRQWLESPQYRQTKKFWPQVDKEVSNDVTRLNRVDLSNVVQLLTIEKDRRGDEN